MTQIGEGRTHAIIDHGQSLETHAWYANSLMMPISHQEANNLSFYGVLSPFSWTRALEASFTAKSVRSISFM
jgi:hypothetical protein